AALEVVAGRSRRDDRRLQVQPADDMPQEDVQGPLVQMAAAGRAEGEIGIAPAKRQRGGERRARPLARLERVRQTLLEPEHLRARAERKAELGDDRRAPEPAARGRRRYEVAPAVGDVDVTR